MAELEGVERPSPAAIRACERSRWATAPVAGEEPWVVTVPCPRCGWRAWRLRVEPS